MITWVQNIGYIVTENIIVGDCAPSEREFVSTCELRIWGSSKF